MFLAGIGTDTGGSIRIPAAFCGVSGLMPTFGRVPKSGCVPLGYTLDHIGPLARSAADCAAFLSVIAGYDPSDPYCADRPVPDFVGALTGDLVGVRIGVERAHHSPEDGDPAMPGCLEAALEALVSLGATIVDVEIDHYNEVVAAAMITMSCEALAYHCNDLGDRWDDYFRATRPYVALGALVSGADYVQAQRVRRVGQAELAALFGNVDLIVTPTSAVGSPRLDQMTDGIGDLLNKVYTPYWDAVGNPVLVVPMGFTEAGLPLSLQMAARPFDEALLVRAGDAFQKATEWHLQVPPLAAPVAS
jgi:aspartyl-tRNA(Asn)/glutamyl-tRNA(Gln) amidotransferase subunit A